MKVFVSLFKVGYLYLVNILFWQLGGQAKDCQNKKCQLKLQEKEEHA